MNGSFSNSCAKVNFILRLKNLKIEEFEKNWNATIEFLNLSVF